MNEITDIFKVDQSPTKNKNNCENDGEGWPMIIADFDSKAIIEANTQAKYLFNLSGQLEDDECFLDFKRIFPDQTNCDLFLKQIVSRNFGLVKGIKIKTVAGDVLRINIHGHLCHIDGKQLLILFFRKASEESKQGNIALSESEARFRAFFEQSPDAVYILDEDDNILDVNPAACEMLGYTHGEFLKMSSVADCRAPEMGPKDKYIVKSELAKARPFEGLDQHKDGRKIPVEVRTGRLIGTPGNLALAIVRDISERKKLTENLERQVTDRMNELAVLYEVFETKFDSSQLRDVLDKKLERVQRVMNSKACLLYLVNRKNNCFDLFVKQGITLKEADQFQTMLSRSNIWDKNISNLKSSITYNLNQVYNTPTGLQGEGTSPFVGVPVRFRDRFYGMLCLFMEMGGRNLTKEEESLLSALTDQVGIIIEITQLRQQLKVAAAREERQRLARYLHDSITQSLYSLTYLAETWRRLAKNGCTDKVPIWLDELDDHVKQIIKEMRLLLYELYPPDLKKMTLVEALKKRLDTVAACTGIRTDFSVDNEKRLSVEIEEEIYSIVLETLNNVMKHSQATVVSINLNYLDKKVFLFISDNGKGFDVSKLSTLKGMGLENIRERVNLLNGILEIDSRPGYGTKVKVIINSFQELSYG